MEKLNTSLWVDDVLNGMSKDLNQTQLKKLKDILCIKLHEVDLYQQTFEVAVLDENNDSKKLERFIVYNIVNDKSKQTIDQYVYSIKRLREFINKNFVDITSDDIQYYFATNSSSGKWSQTTQINQQHNLNAFFTWMVDEEFITKNPMRKITLGKKKKIQKHPYSVQDLEKMRNVCYKDVRDIALFEFLLATALRVSSVISLKWRDIDFHERTGTVKVKGGDVNVFNFNKKALFYLGKLLNERMQEEGRTLEEMQDRPVFTRKRRHPVTKDYEALSAEGVRDILKRIAREAGVQNVHPHRFRRTFACTSIEHGMPVDRVKGVLMHKNIETTFTYLDYTNESLKQSYKTYCE